MSKTYMDDKHVSKEEEVQGSQVTEVNRPQDYGGQIKPFKYMYSLMHDISYLEAYMLAQEQYGTFCNFEEFRIFQLGVTIDFELLRVFAQYLQQKNNLISIHYTISMFMQHYLYKHSA